MKRWGKLIGVEPSQLGDPLLDRLINNFEIDLCLILEPQGHRNALAVCAQSRSQ
jgi:hypothetical protein